MRRSSMTQPARDRPRKDASQNTLYAFRRFVVYLREGRKHHGRLRFLEAENRRLTDVKRNGVCRHYSV